MDHALVKVLLTVGGGAAYGVLAYLIFVYPAIELSKKFGFAWGIGYSLLLLTAVCLGQKIGYFD